MSVALKDKLLEVEMFVGEKLADYTNEQVIQKVRKEFGLQMYVDHAEELLHEFQQEIRSEKAIAWEAIQW
jgi:5-enolpyruvylshikimate-3-phosphate synthase|tara:strand:- start:208 stop:417 length:210 start_codon:yes stop_codon:yes gene_type:complete